MMRNEIEDYLNSGREPCMALFRDSFDCISTLVVQNLIPGFKREPYYAIVQKMLNATPLLSSSGNRSSKDISFMNNLSGDSNSNFQRQLDQRSSPLSPEKHFHLTGDSEDSGDDTDLTDLGGEDPKTLIQASPIANGIAESTARNSRASPTVGPDINGQHEPLTANLVRIHDHEDALGCHDEDEDEDEGHCADRLSSIFGQVQLTMLRRDSSASSFSVHNGNGVNINVAP